MTNDHETAPILVVEAPDVQDLICRALELHGLAATQASAARARELIAQRRVDLVITNVPQIIPTEHTRILYLGDGPTVSGSNSLPKPFKLDQLVSAARELLSAARGTILLVDDLADDRALIRAMLERRGFAVAEAASGREALAIAEGLPRPPALAVLDVVMPEMSGPELAEELRARWPSLPVLFVSSYADNAALRPAMLRDIPYIGKPFTYQTLIAKVQGLLENRLARGAASPQAE